MSRVVQPAGERGSLKWIQRFVNERPADLDSLVLPHLNGASSIDWLSPRSDDGFAEYRDAAFLDRLGETDLSAALSGFWPKRGPQWDALARSDNGDLLLIEAKAHVGEVCSPGTQSKAISRSLIETSLSATSKALGATPRAAWADVFFQYANRLAHLDFLRRTQGRPAWLVFVYFVGDTEMQGPRSRAEWLSALKVVKHVMGLPERHALSRYVIDIFPDVG